MDGDLDGGFLDVDRGYALDLGDFGLWLWIWLQQGRLLGCVAHRLCSQAGRCSSAIVVPCSDGTHGECAGQVGLPSGARVCQAVAWGR